MRRDNFSDGFFSSESEVGEKPRVEQKPLGNLSNSEKKSVAENLEDDGLSHDSFLSSDEKSRHSERYLTSLALSGGERNVPVKFKVNQLDYNIFSS